MLAGFVSMPCAAEFRDPTQPAYPLPSSGDTGAVAGSINLVLSAIWISSQSKRAIINGILAKQGQTIEVKQAQIPNPEPVTPTKTAAADNQPEELLNKVLRPAPSNGYANAGSPTQENSAALLENIAGPMGGMIAPLLATAIGSMDVPQLQGQNTRQQANTSQRPASASRTALAPASMQSPETALKPARSSTVKIIDIQKNSVTIEQDGERKTLQLVQRPYKTQ